MDYLQVRPKNAEAAALSHAHDGLLTYDEFVSRMLKIGFGHAVRQHPSPALFPTSFEGAQDCLQGPKALQEGVVGV